MINQPPRKMRLPGNDKFFWLLRIAIGMAVMGFLGLVPDAHGEEAVGRPQSVAIRVVGMSHLGHLYEKRADLRQTARGYSLRYSCLATKGRKGECGCSKVNGQLREIEVEKLLTFISTLGDGGENARCCHHPWTEIGLTYSSHPRQRNITVPFDLLKVEEMFNFCGTPVVPFDPQDPGSQLRLGKQFYMVGLPERAVEALEQAVTLGPQSVAVQAYEALGGAYRSLRSYEKAVEAYNHLLSLRPREARTLLTLGGLYSEFGRKQEAVEAYRQALALQPTDDIRREAYASLGVLYKDLGRFTEAEKVMQEALRIDPKNAFIRYSIGQVYLELGDADAALRQYEALKTLASDYATDLQTMIYQRAIRQNPQDPVAQFNMGNAFYWTQRYSDAIEFYREAIRLKPDLELAYSRLGGSYAELGEYDKAIEAFTGAIRLDPQSSIDHVNLGLAYFYVGKSDLAIAHLRESIRLKPDLAEAHNNLGYVLRETGRYAEAIEVLKAAIRLKPDQERAHYNLGLAYRKIGQYEKAVQSLKQAIRLNPQNPNSHFNLGNVYGDLKRYRAAVGAYKEAVDLQPNFVESRFQLGVMYLKLGDRKGAIQEYESLEVWDQKRAQDLRALVCGRFQGKGPGCGP